LRLQLLLHLSLLHLSELHLLHGESLHTNLLGLAVTRGLPVREHAILQLNRERPELAGLDERDLQAEGTPGMVGHHKRRRIGRQRKDNRKQKENSSANRVAIHEGKTEDQEYQSQERAPELESAGRRHR
jgi:hypothetical protein